MMFFTDRKNSPPVLRSTPSEQKLTSNYCAQGYSIYKNMSGITCIIYYFYSYGIKYV